MNKNNKDYLWMKSLVRGYIWKIKFYNESIFEMWTPKDICRKEGLIMLLKFTNGDNKIYNKSDIKQLWKTKG